MSHCEKCARGRCKISREPHSYRATVVFLLRAVVRSCMHACMSVLCVTMVQSRLSSAYWHKSEGCPMTTRWRTSHKCRTRVRRQKVDEVGARSQPHAIKVQSQITTDAVATLNPKERILYFQPCCGRIAVSDFLYTSRSGCGRFGFSA